MNYLFITCRGIGKKEKAAFREAFGRLSELRSFLATCIPVLALTAIANKEMRNRLAKYLGMKRIKHIVVSPNKNNIRFTVLHADKELHCFDWLINLLLEKKGETDFTIIFCRTVNDIVSLLTHFLMRLGPSGTHTDGDEPMHERCLLGVFYSQMPKDHKKSVTSSFEGLSGNVRVVFASTSLSMGVDFPHVRYVLHYGPSRNLTSHLQEAGRGGRDGKQAFHLTIYHGRHLTACEKDIKRAVTTSTNSCCPVSFLKDFDDEVCPLSPLHDCCNVCHKACMCNADASSCSQPVPAFNYLPESLDHDGQRRGVSVEERECLHSALKEMQLSLSCQAKLTMFDSTGILTHGFSDELINEIVSNVETTFNVYDLIERCTAPSLKVAVITLEVINEIFGDIVIPDELYSLVNSKEYLSDLNRLISTIPTINVNEFEDLSDNSDC